jgi:hypothetical protein
MILFPNRFTLALVIGSTTIASYALSSFAQQGIVSNILDRGAVDLQLADSLMSTEVLPPQEPEPLFPAPTCWAGLSRLDEVGDLESFSAALQQAVASDDLLLTAYLQERLAEFISAEQNNALEVIAYAESVAGEELIILPQALKQSEAGRAPQIVEKLLTTAETHADPQHRIAALRALQAQVSLSTVQLDRLVVLAKAEDTVAPQAILVIGRVMEKDYGRSEEYMERLLDIAQSQKTPDLARLAIEMGADAKPVFEEASFQKLADLLLHHPSTDVRKMAALVITSARNTDGVLKVFQQAFRENDDFCSRWDAIRFSVTAAGAKALPVIKELVELDSRFQPDYLDYKTLYDSGMVDYAHVFHAKKDQHEECSGDNN